MAIVRSRGAALESFTVMNPGVERARDELQDQIAAIREQVRAEVQQECQQRIDQAEQRAAQAEKKSQQAVADVQARFGPLLEAMNTVTSRIHELEHQTIRACEGEVVALATALAAQILRREVDSDQHWMKPVFDQAVDGLQVDEALVARLHPQDAAAFRELLEQTSATAGVKVIADSQLRRGGMVLRSGGTDRDVGVPSTWERAAQALRHQAPAALSNGYDIDIDRAQAPGDPSAQAEPSEEHGEAGES